MDVDCGSVETEEFEMICQGVEQEIWRVQRIEGDEATYITKNKVWEKSVELGVEEPVWDTFGFSYVFFQDMFDYNFNIGHIYIKHKGKRKRRKPKLTQG